MSTDAKAAPPNQKRTWVETSKMPHLPLYDEQRRFWGFFLPEDPAVLKTRTAEEWYRVARKLLDDKAVKETSLSMLIPFVDDSGKVNGRFYLSPWPDVPDAPPTPLTRAEVMQICKAADESGKTLTFDEVMAALGEIDEEDDVENEET